MPQPTPPPSAFRRAKYAGEQDNTSAIGYRCYQVLSNSWWCAAWMSVDPEAEVAAGYGQGSRHVGLHLRRTHSNATL
jgi:hypothetical protein